MNSLESIPIYVVTVKTFIDRHAHMAGLEKRLGVKFEYIWDHDADELSDAACAGVDGDMSTKVSLTFLTLRGTASILGYRGRCLSGTRGRRPII